LTAGVLSAVLGTLSFAFAQAPSPVDPDAKLAQLAIEAARSGKVEPIPLDSSGGPPHGVIYDRFLLGVVAAKAAIATGRTPFAASPGFVPQTMVVVAYARQCEGRVSPAQSVRMSARTVHPPASEGQTPMSSMDPVREVSTGAAAKVLLPGVTLPASSLVVGFASTPMTDATITIAYTEPLCPATLKTVDLTVHTVPARAVKMVTTAPMPSDQPNLASTPVQMQVLIDRDGSLKFPVLIQGPPALEAPAASVLKQWQFEPARANDVAIVQVTQVPITFVSADRPVAAATPASPPASPPASTPAKPAAPADAPVAATPVLTSSRDEPGLTSATSKCPVSDDTTYGLSPANPIRIGGGAEAVSREERYMAALRGPGGVGLNYRRTGAMLAPDQKTILDVYEVTYFGVVQPVRLYFDRTQADVLKAPKAWACNQEINKR
jgi:hypothetical protein